MDEEKAARTLAKELGDKLGKMIVAEDNYKEGLIENASAVYQLDNPLLLEYKYGEFRDDKNCRKNILEVILLQKGSFEEANYYFFKSISSSGNSSTQSNIIITPYALIGKKEENALRMMFYKDVRSDIILAMDVLKIKNFVNIFPIYSGKDINSFNYVECLKFIDFVSQIKYDRIGEVGKKKFDEPFGGIDKLNILFGKIGIEGRISTKGYLHENNLLSVVNQLKGKLNIKKDIKHVLKGYSRWDEDFLNDFSEFIFSLPFEDQNTDDNKEVLRRSENMELIVDLLIKEYAGSNKPVCLGVPVTSSYFQEYFDVLDEDMQEQVVKSLRLVSHNPAHDSFLWSKGFKNVEIDYLKFYKEDAQVFIDYFKGRTAEEKKIILGDVLGCDHINKEVVDWLDANESELLKEASFNG